MEQVRLQRDVKPPGRYSEQACSLQDFVAALHDGRDEALPEFADRIDQHVPIYDCSKLQPVLDDTVRRAELQHEWADVLEHGAGVFVLKRAFADTAPVDAATAIFEDIIREERQSGAAAADHFAKAGANDRIWNAQQKLCLRAPSVFARYYANPLLVAAAQAWLGPCFQMTAQVNVVRPGGAAQQAHRDYHRRTGRTLSGACAHDVAVPDAARRRRAQRYASR